MTPPPSKVVYAYIMLEKNKNKMILNILKLCNPDIFEIIVIVRESWPMFVQNDYDFKYSGVAQF